MVFLPGFQAKKGWIAATSQARDLVEMVQPKQNLTSWFATARRDDRAASLFCTYLPHKARSVGFPSCRPADSRTKGHFKNM
jgi:hypothetical protein